MKSVEKRHRLTLSLGNFQKDAFLATLRAANSQKTSFFLEKSEEYAFAENYGKVDEFKSFVPIMHGCNNFCSYCIVPFVRGREVSRSPDTILKEIRSNIARGVKEITLLGQNVNSYKFEMGNRVITFPSLLEMISRETPDLPWLRFLTSHPKDFFSGINGTVGEKFNPLANTFICQFNTDRIEFLRQ